MCYEGNLKYHTQDDNVGMFNIVGVYITCEYEDRRLNAGPLLYSIISINKKESRLCLWNMQGNFSSKYERHPIACPWWCDFRVWFVFKLCHCCIWVRPRNCGCLVTRFCYQLIAKPGNKAAAVLWPDPYDIVLNCNVVRLTCVCLVSTIIQHRLD